MNMLSRVMLLLALAMPVGVLAPAGLTPIPAAEAAETQVALQMLVVHATDSTTGVDPRLQALASSFKYFKYKGYKLLSTQNAELGAGKDTSFSLEGSRKVKASLISVDETRAKLRVEISGRDSKFVDTTVSISRDGTFIVAGPRYEDGILMLLFRASY